MNLIQKLRELPGVEEVKIQIVLDRIKEDTTIFIPEKIRSRQITITTSLNLVKHHQT